MKPRPLPGQVRLPTLELPNLSRPQPEEPLTTPINGSAADPNPINKESRPELAAALERSDALLRLIADLCAEITAGRHRTQGKPPRRTEPSPPEAPPDAVPPGDLPVDSRQRHQIGEAGGIKGVRTGGD